MSKTINVITRDDVKRFSENAGYMDSIDVNGNALDLYQQTATKSAIYPGQGTPLGLVYTALKGCGEAGEFAEHVGKAMRDDGLIPHEIGSINVAGKDTPFDYFSSDGALTPERREALKKELGDKLWYIAASAKELGYTLSEVALGNLEKLCDRGERGTLQGSGDER